jgi:hypothetical protein
VISEISVISKVPIKGPEAKLKEVAKPKGLLLEPTNYILITSKFGDEPLLVISAFDLL